jgi:hypothetical protein
MKIQSNIDGQIPVYASNIEGQFPLYASSPELRNHKIQKPRKHNFITQKKETRTLRKS